MLNRYKLRREDTTEGEREVIREGWRIENDAVWPLSVTHRRHSSGNCLSVYVDP